MPEWVRVKDKSTNHKYSVVASVVDADPEAFQVLKQPATDVAGDPLPPEYADKNPAPSGQTATDTTPKEK